jgi:hypothetical protein
LSPDQGFLIPTFLYLTTMKHLPNLVMAPCLVMLQEQRRPLLRPALASSLQLQSYGEQGYVCRVAIVQGLEYLYSDAPCAPSPCCSALNSTFRRFALPYYSSSKYQN